MSRSKHAASAYRSADSHRSLREQEADVFRRANGALRAARDASPADRIRAIADNRRLWLLVSDLVMDPQNGLPLPLRAGLASIARTVQAEVRRPSPDFDFMIAVNENIAAGLSSGSVATSAAAVGLAAARSAPAGAATAGSLTAASAKSGRERVGSGFSSDS